MYTAVLEQQWEKDPKKRIQIFQFSSNTVSLRDLLSSADLLSLQKYAYFLGSSRMLSLESNLFSSVLTTFTRVTCNLRLAGGKGGYGSLLRAQGNKMSSQRSTNLESCRNLSGQRLRTIHQSQAIAEHIQKQPQVQKEKRAKIKDNIERIIDKYESSLSPSAVIPSEFFDTAEKIELQIEESLENVLSKPSSSVQKLSSSCITYWEEEEE